jgi:hypothetical protein
MSIEADECLKILARKGPDGSFIDPGTTHVEYDSIRLLSTIHGALSSLKALLDVFAVVVCSLLRVSAGNFGRANVSGKSIAGGALINSLRKSAPRDSTSAKSLADILERHSKDWITSAVAVRDAAHHQTSIASFRRIGFIIHRENGEIVQLEPLPIALEEEFVDAYFAKLVTNLRFFVKECLPLLPGVDMGRLAPDAFGNVYLRVQESQKAPQQQPQ